MIKILLGDREHEKGDMSGEEGRHWKTPLAAPCQLLCFLLFLLLGRRASGDDLLARDRDVLLELKKHLQLNNPVNQGDYASWNGSDATPCNWKGITCGEEEEEELRGSNSTRVTRIDLRHSSIGGPIFPNFSHLTALRHLDLSCNTLEDGLPPDFNQCANLRYLNLSRNLLTGELDLHGLTRLEVLDLTLNRLRGPVQPNFPAICARLVTLNLSTNSLTGNITATFRDCPRLQYLDLSANRFTGEIWPGVSGLLQLSLSENNLGGGLPPELFDHNCSLQVLDLSANGLRGKLPASVANCRGLKELNLWGNNLSGAIPGSIGQLSSLVGLYLGKNKLDRSIPEQLLNCSRLAFLDLSTNSFGGKVQPIFGRFVQVRFLVLHSNDYVGGIEESGILGLPNIRRLDLSYNNFSGELPIGVVNLTTLRFLVLAYNNFSGRIPPEYGRMKSLQSLDLSFNRLTGTIPSTVGNLTSLLWLMLANNSLTGEIPGEIGNCRSLLWLNLANNSLSGEIPSTIAGVGRDPWETFHGNSLDNETTAFSGECLSMRRWIPASYPPFSFAFTIMTRKTCRRTWDRLLKGIGLFPMCADGSSAYRSLRISGFVQLSGNELTGHIPPEMGRMRNFTLFHLDRNQLSGPLPPEIADPPLVVLNVSRNNLSGSIPTEIGNLRCLRNLDLSYNNFSGEFPTSLDRLTELSKFNVSYNPLLTGNVYLIGQMGTFYPDSFIGDGQLNFSAKGDRNNQTAPQQSSKKRTGTVSAIAFYAILGVTTVVVAAGASCCIWVVGIYYSRQAQPAEFAYASEDIPTYRKENNKQSPSLSTVTSAGSSSSTTAVRIFRADCPRFTYEDVVRATGGFTETAVIGRGGFGTVYRGVFGDGRCVAVKKLERGGEKETRAEMEVVGRLAHPNLVPLYGCCLQWGTESYNLLLVYEYMVGGSLEEAVGDWGRLGRERRVELAQGVARALVYLHHECEPPVVHRDVKASNVLMDGEGNGRLTDFGLARVVRPEETHVSTMVAGTVGYVAPEYGQTWQATTKGDVYSFGVLVMELATGRKAVGGGEEEEEGECLVEWARRRRRYYLENLEVDVVEGRREEQRWREMGDLLRVGMRCTADAPQERPDMREVLQMLRKIKISRDTDPKQ